MQKKKHVILINKMAFSHCFPRPGFLTLKVPAIAAVLAVSRPQAGNTVALLSAELTGLVACTANGRAAFYFIFFNGIQFSSGTIKNKH